MPVIVVTGASAGIGKATARRFLDEGWHVALLARRMDPLLELAQGRASALPIACDVTDEGQVDAAFAAT
ncbi:MAG: SDR family NAD(P)-dependent oxidoreductase, partial [Rhodobacteraceae bacterium]|nr:SDR family NAD(P)-dependent oxidoreductase [Paracoccaceae bacterium]